MAEAGIEERGAIFTRPRGSGLHPKPRGLHGRPGPRAPAPPGALLWARRLRPAPRSTASWPPGAREAAPEPIRALAHAIWGVELHRASWRRTRELVVARLSEEGLAETDAEALATAWLMQGDFLLADFAGGAFDVVIGNPPYVRQELIPDALMAEYRARFATIYDRADIYVPFIERSLDLLAEGGRCGFICSDRWMKNRYGGPLRAYVARGFHLRAHVDMVNTPAFHSDVVAYPAITVIAREAPGPTRIAYRPEIDADALAALTTELTGPSPDPARGVRELACVAAGAEPWVLEASDQLALVRRLEASFPPSRRPVAAWGSASRPARTRRLSAALTSSTSRKTASSPS